MNQVDWMGFEVFMEIFMENGYKQWVVGLGFMFEYRTEERIKTLSRLRSLERLKVAKQSALFL